MPQGLGLWDDMSAAENLAFAAAAFGSSPPPLDAELAAAQDVLVRDLPLGLKRRLAFASALAHAPELLILDEPTSGVDPQARARLWDTVHEAAAGGAGVLVTTHYLEETSQCDRLVIMAAGRVVAEGREAAIVGDRAAVEVELGWRGRHGAAPPAGRPPSASSRTPACRSPSTGARCAWRAGTRRACAPRSTRATSPPPCASCPRRSRRRSWSSARRGRECVAERP